MRIVAGCGNWVNAWPGLFRCQIRQVVAYNG
jgi:hypothetical protein